MELTKQKSGNLYDLQGLSFTQVKIIKDACKSYAKMGSAQAEAIAKELEGIMEKVVI